MCAAVGTKPSSLGFHVCPPTYAHIVPRLPQVVPVVQPMASGSTLVPVSMLVPPGEWIDWHTHHVVSGPIITQRTFTIVETGVYVRAGSIVVTKVWRVGTGTWVVSLVLCRCFVWEAPPHQHRHS
jgi:hypothetical protein